MPNTNLVKDVKEFLVRAGAELDLKHTEPPNLSFNIHLGMRRRPLDVAFGDSEDFFAIMVLVREEIRKRERVLLEETNFSGLKSELRWFGETTVLVYRFDVSHIGVVDILSNFLQVCTQEVTTIENLIDFPDASPEEIVPYIRH